MHAPLGSVLLTLEFAVPLIQRLGWNCCCCFVWVCVCVWFSFSLPSQIWQRMKCLLENYANAVRGNTKCRKIETWKKSNTSKKQKTWLVFSEQMPSKHDFNEFRLCWKMIAVIRKMAWFGFVSHVEGCAVYCIALYAVVLIVLHVVCNCPLCCPFKKKKKQICRPSYCFVFASQNKPIISCYRVFTPCTVSLGAL